MTEFDIGNTIDTLFKDKPTVLKKVKENRNFINYIKENKVVSSEAEIPVFGVKSVNINAILKNNINDHSIFTIDKLCRMHRNMLYEQLKKYQSKKRTMPTNILFLIIIIFGVVGAIIVILFLLPSLGGIIP